MLECYNLSFNSNKKEYSLNYDTGDIQTKIENLIEGATRKDGLVIIEHDDILKDWFPKTGCHLFLSHSSKDKELAIYIANKLYEKYNIKTFIDSQFWGFVDEAIVRVTHALCKSSFNKDLLDYNKSMRVASNFYLVLANALTNAIDQSDSCIFLNTENSLNAKLKDEFATYSPWIYTELNFTSQVERRPHQNRPKPMMESASLMHKAFNRKTISTEGLSIRYKTSLEHMINVDDSRFEQVLNGVPLSRVELEDSDSNNCRVFKCLDEIYKTLNASKNNDSTLLY